MQPQMMMTTLAAATDLEALAAMRQARELFGRVLAGWASDMLEVRRLGLDRAQWLSPDAAEARLRRAA